MGRRSQLAPPPLLLGGAELNGDTNHLNAHIAAGMVHLLTPLLPPGFEVRVGADSFDTLFEGTWTGSSGLWLDEDDTPATLALRWQLVLDGVQSHVMHTLHQGWPIWRDDGSDFTVELAGNALRVWAQRLPGQERIYLGEVPLS